jgi:hypothetical protein
MSGPTKGMVAGQGIKTGELTKEYDEGFTRTFGERKPERGRFIYDPETKSMVRVDADWTDAERRAPTPTEGLVYGNLQASDGTPIDTRRKHREYKRQNGLADKSDYTEHNKKSEARRADYYGGRGFDQGLTETIGRALYAAKKKRRR